MTTSGITTYAELDQQASRVANALLAAGVRAGDRVAYLGENSPEFLAVLYGTSKAGGIPTALNFRLSPTEVDYILRDAAPSVMVLGSGHEDLEAIARAAGIGTIVTMDAYADWLGTVSDDDPGVRRDTDATALMFYTSGTTGHPKGIELTGPNLGQALAAMSTILQIDTTSVALAPVPFFHVTGLGLALVAAVNGAALLLINPTGPADLCRILQEHRVSHAVAVPTVIQFLLTLPEVRSGDWSALKYIVYGAAPIPESVLCNATEVFGCSFVQSYGLTESTGGVTILNPADHRPTPQTVQRLRSVGKPMADVPIRVVDPATLHDLPTGERGEVLIGGGHLMKRYWRNPEATASAITDDGWLRTGDGGSFDTDGYLYIHDRLKDMIVSGGENVYPAEIESVLTSHPAVAQVAVIGVASARWGESPVAVVVPAADAVVVGAELISWARERLAHYKCPSEVIIADALPMTASGKVMKSVLRQAHTR